MMGALAWVGRKLTVTTSQTKRSADLMVLDNGPIHVSKATQAALAARPLAHR
jgi:hypothetical protein